MENAVEALKIAFAVMMFVVALSLSISSLSHASSAVDAIISLNDRETEYVSEDSYVKVTNSNRIVGVETIVPSMYKAYQENFDIYFYKSNGEPLIIYTSSEGKDINYINGSEVFADAYAKVEHLNQILTDGLYENFSGKKFIEQLGEYYVNDSENLSEANKVKKRVITYTITE